MAVTVEKAREFVDEHAQHFKDDISIIIPPVNTVPENNGNNDPPVSFDASVFTPETSQSRFASNESDDPLLAEAALASEGDLRLPTLPLSAWKSISVTPASPLPGTASPTSGISDSTQLSPEERLERQALAALARARAAEKAEIHRQHELKRGQEAERQATALERGRRKQEQERRRQQKLDNARARAEAEQEVVARVAAEEQAPPENSVQHSSKKSVFSRLLGW